MLHLHLQPVFARHDVYTFLVCNHAVLAVRFFTGALGLLRPTLDVGSFISRDSQNIPSLHTTIDEYDQAVTIVRYWEFQLTVVHARGTRHLSFVTFCP